MILMLTKENHYSSLYNMKFFQQRTRVLPLCWWTNSIHCSHTPIFSSFLSCQRSLWLYFFIYIYLFYIYFWLCWVFVAVRGLSLVAVSRGYSSLQCAGFSLWWLLLLRSTGSRCTGSVVVARGFTCSAAWGIFPDQGSNPYPLHRQADS